MTTRPQGSHGPFTPDDLLHAGAFPHAVGQLELRETHVSWVILTGPFAYKIKKPLKLEFLDCSTLERRLALCEEELRLNTRLAPDIYVDVVTITKCAGSVRVGGAGDALEYAVRMRQFDTSQELSSLIEAGAVTAGELVALAQDVARFHVSLPPAHRGVDFAHTRDLHDAVLGNLAALLCHLDAAADFPELNRLIDWTHDYLHRCTPSLRMRERAGAVRECHGDLHSRNIVRWNGRLTPFDCLEFDPRLRWIDVINDVAFLTMDLASRGRRDLAFAFLNAYLEHTGDYGGARHLSFYCVYRALVRATVNGIGAETDVAHREEYRRRSRVRVNTAAALAIGPAPLLILMHGLSGSGKSSVSGALVPLIGAVRLRSDVERKRLVKRRGRHGALYDPSTDRLTYGRLLAAARSCLLGGVDTIVDAAFLRARDRRRFRDLARRMRTGFIILSCEADVMELGRRIESRAASGQDPSDADVAVLTGQIQDQEPLDERELASTAVIDTTFPDMLGRAHDAIRRHRNRMTHL